MMNKAKGPVWHKKQKEQGIIPKGSAALIERQLGASPTPTAGCTAMERLL